MNFKEVNAILLRDFYDHTGICASNNKVSLSDLFLSKENIYEKTIDSDFANIFCNFDQESSYRSDCKRNEKEFEFKINLFFTEELSLKRQSFASKTFDRKLYIEKLSSRCWVDFLVKECSNAKSFYEFYLATSTACLFINLNDEICLKRLKFIEKNRLDLVKINDAAKK